jgi:hypothetical protein
MDTEVIDGNLLGIESKDLVVPLSMVACYVVLMAIFFIASYFYPSLKDKKEKIKNIVLLISFMGLPLALIYLGLTSNM